MTTNHIATNIITNGYLNISALYKGFILPEFKYEIRKKGGGGIHAGEGISHLKQDLEEIYRKKEEIDAIVVYVDWDKNTNKYNKNIYVELIKNKVKAELIPFDKDEEIIVKVNLIN